ncbi:hypothetical protein FBY34_1049 [Streptomyces sp. SLBN-115]|nr:hypothetical protein FBY34_1049 [Streptomyces sp. SLBN-115]
MTTAFRHSRGSRRSHARVEQGELRDRRVNSVIAGQRVDADLVRRLAEQGHEPQATWAADGLLTELDRRIAWSKAHRHPVE